MCNREESIHVFISHTFQTCFGNCVYCVLHILDQSKNYFNENVCDNLRVLVYLSSVPQPQWLSFSSLSKLNSFLPEGQIFGGFSKNSLFSILYLAGLVLTNSSDPGIKDPPYRSLL